MKSIRMFVAIALFWLIVAQARAAVAQAQTNGFAFVYSNDDMYFLPTGYTLCGEQIAAVQQLDEKGERFAYPLPVPPTDGGSIASLRLRAKNPDGPCRSMEAKIVPPVPLALEHIAIRWDPAESNILQLDVTYPDMYADQWLPYRFIAGVSALQQSGRWLPCYGATCTYRIAITDTPIELRRFIRLRPPSIRMGSPVLDAIPDDWTVVVGKSSRSKRKLSVLENVTWSIPKRYAARLQAGGKNQVLESQLGLLLDAVDQIVECTLITADRSSSHTCMVANGDGEPSKPSVLKVLNNDGIEIPLTAGKWRIEARAKTQPVTIELLSVEPNLPRWRYIASADPQKRSQLTLPVGYEICSPTRGPMESRGILTEFEPISQSTTRVQFKQQGGYPAIGQIRVQKTGASSCDTAVIHLEAPITRKSHLPQWTGVAELVNHPQVLLEWVQPGDRLEIHVRSKELASDPALRRYTAFELPDYPDAVVALRQVEGEVVSYTTALTRGKIGNPSQVRIHVEGSALAFASLVDYLDADSGKAFETTAWDSRAWRFHDAPFDKFHVSMDVPSTPGQTWPRLQIQDPDILLFQTEDAKCGFVAKPGEPIQWQPNCANLEPGGDSTPMTLVVKPKSSLADQAKDSSAITVNLEAGPNRELFKVDANGDWQRVTAAARNLTIDLVSCRYELEQMTRAFAGMKRAEVLFQVAVKEGKPAQCQERDWQLHVHKAADPDKIRLSTGEVDRHFQSNGGRVIKVVFGEIPDIGAGPGTPASPTGGVQLAITLERRNGGAPPALVPGASLQVHAAPSLFQPPDGGAPFAFSIELPKEESAAGQVESTELDNGATVLAIGRENWLAPRYSLAPGAPGEWSLYTTSPLYRPCGMASRSGDELALESTGYCVKPMSGAGALVLQVKHGSTAAGLVRDGVVLDTDLETVPLSAGTRELDTRLQAADYRLAMNLRDRVSLRCHERDIPSHSGILALEYADLTKCSIRIDIGKAMCQKDQRGDIAQQNTTQYRDFFSKRHGRQDLVVEVSKPSQHNQADVIGHVSPTTIVLNRAIPASWYDSGTCGELHIPLYIPGGEDASIKAGGELSVKISHAASPGYADSENRSFPDSKFLATLRRGPKRLASMRYTDWTLLGLTVMKAGRGVQAYANADISFLSLYRYPATGRNAATLDDLDKLEPAGLSFGINLNVEPWNFDDAEPFIMFNPKLRAGVLTSLQTDSLNGSNFVDVPMISLVMGAAFRLPIGKGDQSVDLAFLYEILFNADTPSGGAHRGLLFGLTLVPGKIPGN